MIKKSLIIILFSLFIALSTSIYATSEDAATEAANIDPNTIKQNIKKRIEQVIKEQKTSSLEKKIAYLGTISSMTPNSLTIETMDGNVEQASTSANTIYVETETNKEVKREDASIGDFVAALGFIESDAEVLEARRLLILRDPPKKPKKISFYGSIKNIDVKKNKIELYNSIANQTKQFSFSSKSQILVSNPNSLTNQKISLEEVNIGQSALVIFSPSTASTSASLIDNMLIKSTPPTNEASAKQ